MARKDEILKSFLSHELLRSKYSLSEKNIPQTVFEALRSDVPIVKAVAIIVEGLESKPPTTDNDLRNQVNQYLNEVI
jgi:hypothetical protein